MIKNFKVDGCVLVLGRGPCIWFGESIYVPWPYVITDSNTGREYAVHSIEYCHGATSLFLVGASLIEAMEIKHVNIPQPQRRRVENYYQDGE